MSNPASSVMKILIHPLVALLLAIGTFVWQEFHNPYEFNIEIIDEFNVVEVKDKISELKILYKDENILDTNKSIRVFRIRFSNPGDAILQGFYDQNEMFGLKSKNSNVLFAEVLKASSKNLKEKFLKDVTTDTLNFNKVIFDKKSELTLKVITLSQNNEKVVFEVLGKIANVDELEIKRPKPDFDIEKIETKKLLLYIMLVYLFLSFALFLLLFGFEALAKRKRIKFSNEFTNGRVLSVEEDHIINKFINGFEPFEIRLLKTLAKDNIALDVHNLGKEFIPRDFLAPPFISRARSVSLDKDIFSLENNRILFNNRNVTFLKEFLQIALEKKVL